MDQNIRYLANISKNYVVMYIINLPDGTFKKIGSIEAVDRIVMRFQNAQLVMNQVIGQMVYPEFREKMLQFVDLSTIQTRLKDKNVVSCEYYGHQTGWCNAQFMPADFDENGSLKEIFFVVTHIQESKLSSEIYRKALESNAEFVFQFDLTTGILPESFAAIAKKMAPDMDIAFPIEQDRFITEYYAHIKASPVNGYIMRYTIAGMMERFQQGETRLQSEFYSERFDRYYRNEFFLTCNEANGHIVVMAIYSDITRAYVQERETQEEQKLANTALMAFAETYLNVYVVDLSKDLVTIVKDNGYQPSDQVHLNAKQVVYGPSIEGYIRGRVTKEDQDRVRMLMRPETIRQNLDGKKEYSFAYHILDNGEIHDFQARIIKTEQESVYVMGFANIDELLAEEKRKKEIFQKAAEELKKSEIYLNAISTSYNYMVIYNLTQNTYNTIVKNDVMAWNNPKSGDYEDLLRSLVFAFPKDQQERIAQSRKISAQIEYFRSGRMYWEERNQLYDASGKLHWIDERIMYTEDPESGDILGISLSAIVDEEVQKENDFNQITHALVRDYVNVYLIKPQKDEMLAISLKGYLMPGMNQRVGVMISYNKMISAYLNERVVPEDRDRIYHAVGTEYIEQTMADRSEMVLAYHILQDGGEHDYQVKVIRTAEEGTYIFGFKNIDALMVEERRRQKMYQDALEEARRANNAKTDFLARMSHDIRTPINGIVGMTHIMKAELDDREKIKENIEKIELLNRQLELLINDVLEMSRIESGKITLLHEPFELPKMLQKISPAIQIMAENAGVKIAGAHYNITHANVVSSPIHIQRITMNILSNAIKYNSNGGTVECWLDEAPIDHTHSNYIFTFQDTGLGMSEEFIEHMFEPFARETMIGDSSVTGTGLGMAITKELVDLFGGRIDVESKKGVGTTITVTLPLELAKEVPDEKAVEKEVSFEGKRILLVEDNAVNLKIARFILEEEHAIVDTAADGQKAVEAFRKSEPGYYAMILMDIMMPVMNGLEATKAIRRLERADAAVVPIVAMSANAFEEDVKKCLEAGMNDHVAKPLDIDVMKDKIMRWIRSAQ
ncbi:MAG: response regulator [Eubacteriales bacterium]|nr:response regulator [Eubacteriales bacterium]